VARTEVDHLAGILRACDHWPDRRMLLCAGHLSDLIVLAGQRTQALATWQAGCLAAALALSVPSPGTEHNCPASWPRTWRRRAARLEACPLCVARDAAAQQAIEDLRDSLRAAHQIPGHQVPLCVRHLLSLKAADRWAGELAAPAAAELAVTLISELDEAFGKNTWARRHEARGLEMTAWRRAAAFLDGSVLLGSP
jgi:hypothetical protein